MGFLGMRGTGDWATDQRPMNWREMILRLYPNGAAPLTAMMSKMKTEAVDDPQFHWWTKSLPTQAGTVTGVFTDAALAVAYVAGASAGDLLYFRMSAADVSHFRVGHQALLRDASNLDVDVNGLVVERVENGASSYVRVRLMEADDNSGTNDLSDCDRIFVIGNANSEGAGVPDAISYDPSKWYNYTQIFRTPLEITGTALETKLRTNPQAYQELKREVLELHSIEMEKNFFWSIPTETTGDNGKPMRTTMGIIPAIKGGYTGSVAGQGGTVSNYPTATGWDGKTWLQGGEDWLDTQLQTVFRYGKREKLAICGDGALLALNKIVKNGGDFTFTPTTKAYGINIVEWVTPLGKINLLTHPLFNQETTTRNSMVIIEPENIKYRPLKNRDTKFYGDGLEKNTGWTRRDGLKEEFLTEAGLEYHFPIAWAYLTGFGSANTL
jgi:hypothetical protein